MSNPVSQTPIFQTQPSYLTADPLKSNTIQEYTSLFKRPDPFILDPIRVLQPATPTITNESVELHDKAGNVIGNVSYDPNDPNSLLKAYNRLVESEWPIDQKEAAKVALKLQQEMEAEIAKLTLMHQIIMSAIKATRG